MQAMYAREMKEVRILAAGRFGRGNGFPNLSFSQLIRDSSSRYRRRIISASDLMFEFLNCI